MHSQRESLCTASAWDRLVHLVANRFRSNGRQLEESRAQSDDNGDVIERACAAPMSAKRASRLPFSSLTLLAYYKSAKSHFSRDDLRISPPGASRIGLLSTPYGRLKNSIHVYFASLTSISERRKLLSRLRRLPGQKSIPG